MHLALFSHIELGLGLHLSGGNLLLICIISPTGEVVVALGWQYQEVTENLHLGKAWKCQHKILKSLNSFKMIITVVWQAGLTCDLKEHPQVLYGVRREK